MTTKLSSKKQVAETKSVLTKSVKPRHAVVRAFAGTGKTFSLIVGVGWAYANNRWDDIQRGIAEQINRRAGGNKVDLDKFKVTPSRQQKAIWNHFSKVPDVQSIIYCAFNKSIVDEFNQEWGWLVNLLDEEGIKLEFRTVNSLGHRALSNAYGRLSVNNTRIEGLIADKLCQDVWELRKNRPTLLQSTQKLVDLCKLNMVGVDEGNRFVKELVGESDITKLAAHYDIDLNGEGSTIFRLIPDLLDTCLQVDHYKCIDYNDQNWLPVVLRLPTEKFDQALVDECLPSWTPVMMGDGTSKNIKDIEIGDVVRSYNTTNGRAKNCKVTATQKIPNLKPLVKVKVKSNSRTNFVVCTVDHKVWTVNRGWLQAEDLQLDDQVIVESSATTTQKGKISAKGRNHLSKIHEGNQKGIGNKGGTKDQFNSIKGGNGRPLTKPQQFLLDLLGKGWRPEYAIKTGHNQHDGSGYPTCYKVDIANKKFKVAIELDGGTHVGNQLILDEKKDESLRSKGWKVFRFKNRDVAKDAPAIVQLVCPDGENCPATAKVVSVEKTYITEHFVYDITVESCHNFYANGILVHNCQDLSRCKQEFVLKVARHITVVGDTFQAIYGFAGADVDSIPRMEEMLKVKKPMMLSETRRCGKAIVAEAQTIVADFKAHKTNVEGTISHYLMDNSKQEAKPVYRDVVEDGDMCLCRVNGPLVSEALGFIRRGRKALIRGRQFGQSLINFIKKMKAKDVSDLINKVSDWYECESQKESKKKFPSEAKLMNLEDRKECILSFTEDATSIDEVVEKVNLVFAGKQCPNCNKHFNEETDRCPMKTCKTEPDPSGGKWKVGPKLVTPKGIMFSSIHRAKGLEASRVFLLQPEGATIPHPMAKTQWQRNQEMNLKYVAITRAIKELVYVS